MLREIKRFLAGVLILIVAALTVGADSFRTPKGLAGLAWQSTVALYGSKTYPTGPVSHFLCTAELYRKVSGGYGVITAGHCVQTNPPDLQYSVATSIGAPLQPVQLVKAHLGDGMDFAVFLWNTDAKYPTMDFGTDEGLRVGEPVIVVNFAIGLAKQLSRGHITSTTFNKSEVCGPRCEGGFEIHLDGGGAGASGSAVVSVRTHKIIGLVVGEWEEPVGFGVMPISHFAQLAGAPDQAPVDEDAQ
jgi:hypothetical protein